MSESAVGVSDAVTRQNSPSALNAGLPGPVWPGGTNAAGATTAAAVTLPLLNENVPRLSQVAAAARAARPARTATASTMTAAALMSGHPAQNTSISTRCASPAPCDVTTMALVAADHRTSARRLVEPRVTRGPWQPPARRPRPAPATDGTGMRACRRCLARLSAAPTRRGRPGLRSPGARRAPPRRAPRASPTVSRSRPRSAGRDPDPRSESCGRRACRRTPPCWCRRADARPHGAPIRTGRTDARIGLANRHGHQVVVVAVVERRHAGRDVDVEDAQARVLEHNPVMRFFPDW